MGLLIKKGNGRQNEAALLIVGGEEVDEFFIEMIIHWVVKTAITNCLNNSSKQPVEIQVWLSCFFHLFDKSHHLFAQPVATDEVKWYKRNDGIIIANLNCSPRPSDCTSTSTHSSPPFLCLVFFTSTLFLLWRTSTLVPWVECCSTSRTCRHDNLLSKKMNKMVDSIKSQKIDFCKDIC